MCSSPAGDFCAWNSRSATCPASTRFTISIPSTSIPALGRAVTGDGEAYRYLVESIRRFPRPEPFAAMLRTAGFGRVSFTRMSGGIVALHSGWRL